MSIKNNLRAGAFPQVTDDSASGYSAGSQWFVNGSHLICTDATEGAAVWQYVQPKALRCWPSGQRKWPANFATGTNSALATTTDKLIFLPFEVFEATVLDKMAVYVGSTTGGSALVDLGVYDADPLTALPVNRLVNKVGVDIATVSGSIVSDVTDTLLVPGLYWGCAGIKGVATPANMGRLSGANGKYVLRNNMNDGPSPYRCYSAAYTYAGGLPTTAPTVAADATNDCMLICLLSK